MNSIKGGNMADDQNKKEVVGKKPQESKINPSEAPVFSWDTEEFASYEKGGVWTLWIVLVAIALIAVFVWLKNWTGVALIVAAFAALVSQGFAKPRNIRCSIFQGGIVVKEKPHNFADLKSFWIFLSPNPLVRFEQASRFAMPVTMPLGKTDPEQVRLFLSKRLPEHQDRGEDLSDRISRWLKF